MKPSGYAVFSLLVVWLGGCGSRPTDPTDVAPNAQPKTLTDLVGAWELKTDSTNTRYVFGGDGRGHVERQIDITGPFVKGLQQGWDEGGRPLPEDLDRALRALKVVVQSETKFTVTRIDENTLRFEYDESQVRFDIPEDFLVKTEQFTGSEKAAQLRKSAADRAVSLGRTFSADYKGNQSLMRFTLSGGTLRLQTPEGVTTAVDITLNQVP